MYACGHGIMIAHVVVLTLMTIGFKDVQPY